MNAFQTCTNLSDALPLYLPQQLYIKPIARMNISIQLPNVKKLGKSISHWEIMEKLRQLIKPDEFTILKVTKTTLEFVRFEAEVEVKSKLERTISKLDNKTIKLKDFTEMMRVKAAKSKSDFPSRRTWDMFFQDAKDMDDLKPGERPDTIYLSNIPIKWFVPYHLSETEDVTPSEKILYRVFEKFGNIRFVDIPICDPYRKKMKEQISGLKRVNSEFFEGYVQFKDYIGFSKAMDALRDMKLVHKEEDGEAVAVDIKVDFDRTKHLSDASMRRREIVRDRLVRKAKAKEEEDKKAIEEKKQKEQLERQKEIDIKTQKELRRRLREEKRKAKILEKLEVNGSDEMNEKIAREEKKLLKVQRKLEAIRLVEELFRRVHEKKSEENGNLSTLGLDEIKKFKNTSELEVLNQREKLHNAIKGRVMLKTVLSDKRERKNSSTSSSSGEEENKKQEDIFTNPALLANSGLYDASWFGFPYHSFFPIRGMFNPRAARGGLRHFPGPSRGGPPYMRRSRGGYRGGYRGGRKQSYYPPEVEEEYRKYFEKFLHDSRSRSRSRSRRRSRSSSRRRRSYSRSYSRSRSRSRSKSYKSRTRSRRSYSNSRSRSRSRSRSVDSSKFMTPKQLKEQQSRSSSERRRRRRSSTRTPERNS